MGASLEQLSREEVVTLCLLIYFRGLWTAEEIGGKMNTAKLLRMITHVLETPGVSNAEVVALCLGSYKLTITLGYPSSSTINSDTQASGRSATSVCSDRT